MGKRAAPPFLSCFFLLSSYALLSKAGNDHGTGMEAQLGQQRRRGKWRLFVFGDSYADTGNLPINESISWRWPYGITFPGKPSGRFSDGRVLTDYIAKYLGIKSPLPYNKLIKNFDLNSAKYGINFAHGGTGVFQTMVGYPNMSTQMDFFQQIIHEKVYRSQNLSRSIALVSVAGNDYSTYLAKNRDMKNLPDFCESVIHQVVINAKRIQGFGIKKIVITGLHPLGCLPINTASNSRKNCIEGENDFSKFHNQLLKKNIQMLNDDASNPIFAYLDLYSAFMSILKIQKNSSANLTGKLMPCCIGAKGEECGLVDEAGRTKFMICKNLNHSLFWDSIHPSDAGWRAVYSSLKHSMSSTLLY